MTIRITWRRIAAGIAGLIALALAASFSGLIPIAASSGHMAVTSWFLHWTMQNSVRTQSYFSSPSNPADPGAMVGAAGHFANSCAECHGAPGVPPSPVMQAATPHAPDLSRTAGEYSDRELFWIIKHGIKYTGMPAWPAGGRTDEIRRMTAFVRALPHMSAAEYRSLAAPSGYSGPEALQSCVSCHGSDGMGRGDPSIPVIAGQDATYLSRALADYREGRRSSAIMQEIAANLSPKQMAETARLFSAMPGLKPIARDSRRSADSENRTAAIVHEGLPAKQLPACLSCHSAEKRQSYPRLAGQKAAYIEQRLREMRGEKHMPDWRKPQERMHTVARRIPEDDIAALARWWAEARD